MAEEKEPAAAPKEPKAPTTKAPAAPKEPKVKTLTFEEGKSLQKHGQDYFELHPGCPVDEIYVTSDGKVFYGDAKGKNAYDNYLKSLAENSGVTSEKLSKNS